MEPGDFHRLASRLLKDDDPASCRTAISRAYYALYHVARGFLEANHFGVPRSDSTHERIATLLTQSEDPEVMLVGQQLNDLRGLRNKADYRINEPKWEDRKTAQFWVNKVKQHMTTLEAAFGGPKQPGLIASMRRWEQAIKAPPP